MNKINIIFSTFINKRSLKFYVLITSLVLIFIGIQNGEVSVALNKAINLCLECIGIG